MVPIGASSVLSVNLLFAQVFFPTHLKTGLYQTYFEKNRALTLINQPITVQLKILPTFQKKMKN